MTFMFTQHAASDNKLRELFEFHELPECNACGNTRQKKLGFRGGSEHRSGLGLKTRVVRCLDCGLIFANPMPLPRDPSTLYSGTADEYFLHHDLESKRQNASEIIQGLEKRTCGRRLLDVGCGQGVLLDVARRKGWEPEGLDVSVQFARFAHDNFGVPVHIGDIGTVRLAREHYDVVILGAILEHLPDPRRSLAKVYRLLKPGGLVWIDVPNEHGLYYKLGNLWNRFRGKDSVVNLSPTFTPGHLFGFSKKSLSTLLTCLGFKLRSIELYQGVNCLPEARNLFESLERRAVDAVMLTARILRLGDGIVAIAEK
jgi:SAM-dependent methyltransferase